MAPACLSIFQRGSGSSILLKDFICFLWQWCEAGNWIERQNTMPNMLHLQPRREYTVCALMHLTILLLLPDFLMILSSSLFACFCFHSLSQTCDILSRFFKYRFLLYFFTISALPSFSPPVCIWVEDWTSSWGTCKRMASLLLFNWWCLMETSLLMDAVGSRQNSWEPENREQASIWIWFCCFICFWD